jgi:hypothetical protein
MITDRERRSGRVALGVAIGLLAGLVLVPSALAELPEFNLLSTPPAGSEGTTISQMNMATGEFSGTSVIEREHFTVTGTESGNKSESVLKLEGGGYESFDTDYYEILPDGNIGGPGSFHDTNGTKESYTSETSNPAATVPSSTSITCTPSGSTDTCTATVSGAGGTPTGNATFSASSGSFSGEEACVLSDGSCSVSYLPPTGETPDVKAVYSADGTFRVSEDTTKEQEEVAAKEKEAATAKEKAEKEAKEKKEKEETAGKRKSAVEVTCTINVDGSKPSTCTAQVGDGTGGNPVEVPTGSVKFSTTLGSFAGDTCTLAHSSSGNTSFCVVQYAPPAGQSIIETELPIKAVYSGDASFNPGEGAFKLQEMGIEATEFEDERINREACDALDNTTVDVDEKTGEVTIPYTAPEPGSAQAKIEDHDQIFGEAGSGGLALRGPLPQTPASIADDEGAAPSSPISKECEAKLALAPEGAKKASLSAPLALTAKKGSKKQKGKKGKPKGTTIAKANIKLTHAGPVKLHIHLNKAGKKLLVLMKREHKHAHVTIKLQFKR